jgi:hypothetical protein
MPLALSQSIAYSQSGVPFNRNLAFSLPNLNANDLQYAIKTIGTADESLNLGSVAAIGWVTLHNLALQGSPPSAVLGAITQAGTPGTNNYSYLVVSKFNDASQSLSNTVATALGAATLTGVNYNILTWAAVTGALTYDVYRISSDGSPATLGKIATAATSPYHDIGGAGDGTTATEIDSQFTIVYGDLSADYPLSLRAGESAQFRWTAAAIHVKSNVIPTLLESWISPV